ncbi:hypothetical protein HY212_03860 [Candidatus Pacearchaeota archaeon]|nr:hypothetical protein [Candidatus Pacearchaeota archaeon]
MRIKLFNVLYYLWTVKHNRESSDIKESDLIDQETDTQPEEVIPLEPTYDTKITSVLDNSWNNIHLKPSTDQISSEAAPKKAEYTLFIKDYPLNTTSDLHNIKINLPKDSDLTVEKLEFILEVINELPEKIKEILSQHGVNIWIKNQVPEDVAKRYIEAVGGEPAATIDMNTLYVTFYLEHLNDNMFLKKSIWHEMGHGVHSLINKCLELDPSSTPAQFLDKVSKSYSLELANYFTNNLNLNAAQVKEFNEGRAILERPDIPAPNTNQRKNLHYQLDFKEILAEMLSYCLAKKYEIPEDTLFINEPVKYFSGLEELFTDELISNGPILDSAENLLKQVYRTKKVCIIGLEDSGIRKIIKENDITNKEQLSIIQSAIDFLKRKIHENYPDLDTNLVNKYIDEQIELSTIMEATEIIE